MNLFTKHIFILLSLGSILALANGCQFSRIHIVSLNANHNIDIKTAVIEGQETQETAIYHQLQQLVTHGQNPPYIIDGNPNLGAAASFSQNSELNPDIIADAGLDVFCIGGICDQIWLRGSAVVTININNLDLRLSQILARDDEGTMQLSGEIIRHQPEDILSDYAKADLVFTANGGETIITLDQDSLLNVQTKDEIEVLHGVFTAESLAHGIYLDGTIKPR